jgi:hypothetical protein
MLRLLSVASLRFLYLVSEGSKQYRDKLSSIQNFLSFYDSCRVVYPTKTKAGAYAELVLTSTCPYNKKYDKRTDSCV